MPEGDNCFMRKLVEWWVAQLEMDRTLNYTAFDRSWACAIIEETITKHLEAGCRGDCRAAIPESFLIKVVAR